MSEIKKDPIDGKYKSKQDKADLTIENAFHWKAEKFHGKAWLTVRHSTANEVGTEKLKDGKLEWEEAGGKIKHRLYEVP